MLLERLLEENLKKFILVMGANLNHTYTIISI